MHIKQTQRSRMPHPSGRSPFHGSRPAKQSGNWRACTVLKQRHVLRHAPRCRSLQTGKMTSTRSAAALRALHALLCTALVVQPLGIWARSALAFASAQKSAGPKPSKKNQKPSPRAAGRAGRVSRSASGLRAKAAGAAATTAASCSEFAAPAEAAPDLGGKGLKVKYTIQSRTV